MRPKLRKILRVAGIALGAAVLIAVAFSLYAYFHKPFLKRYVERTLAKTPGLSLEIGRLDYRIFPLRVEADAVRVEMASAMGTLRVSTEKAEGQGSLSRLIRGEAPLLDSLKISGLRLEFDQPADLPPSEKMSLRDLAQTASRYLAYFGELTVRAPDVDLDFKALGLAASFEDLDFESFMGTEGFYELRAGRIAVRMSGPEIDFAASVASAGTWPPQSLDWFRGDVSIRNAGVSLPEKAWKWDEPDSSLEAAFSLDGAGASFSRLVVTAPDLVAVSVSGRMDWAEDLPLEASLRIDVKDIARARKIMGPFLAAGIAGLTTAGGVTFDGRLNRDNVAGTAREALSGTLLIPGLQVGYVTEGLEYSQSLKGEFRIEGPLADLKAKGHLEATEGRIQTEAVRAEGLSLALSLDYGAGKLRIQDFRATVRSSALAAGPGVFGVENLSLTGKALIDPRRKTADISGLGIDVPGLGHFDLSGEGRFGARAEYRASLTAADIGVADTLAFLSPVLPESVPEWNAVGKFALTLDSSQGPPDRGGPEASGSLHLAQASFQNPSGTILSEGLDARLDFSAVFGPAGSAVPFRLLFELPKGETLWNEAYFNWGTQPFRFEGKGDFDPSGNALRRIEATLSYPPFGEIAVAGSSSFGLSSLTDIRVSAPSLDLASLYSFYSTMKPTQPVSWDLAGRAGLDLTLRLARTFSARGLLRIHEAEGGSKDGATGFTGLMAEIPFSIANRPVAISEDADFFIAPGRVRIEAFRTPAFAVEPLDVSFFSARNLFLLFPVELSLWGTAVRLGKSVVSINPAASSVRGISTLSFGELDLSHLTEKNESFKLTGKASIPPSRLVIRPGELILDGTLVAEIYGGKATVRNIQARDAFSGSRTIFFDAEIKGLDLEKLTDAVPFGRVTGIVDVTVGNFALSYGQPESFDLKIESVLVKGVPKKFSLKAVDDLQVISSGGGTSMPSSSFLTRFISSFNYERIGIACSLRNDVFTLQSTIVEGGVHYLVRRSPLFGIDVVNKKPVNKIGFKDMLGRLKRVGESQEKK